MLKRLYPETDAKAVNFINGLGDRDFKYESDARLQAQRIIERQFFDLYLREIFVKQDNSFSTATTEVIKTDAFGKWMTRQVGKTPITILERYITSDGSKFKAFALGYIRSEEVEKIRQELNKQDIDSLFKEWSGKN